MPDSRLLPLLLALAPLVGWAQVNTEAMRNREAWTGVRAELGASLAAATGNTEFLEVGTAGRVDIHSHRNEAFVVGELQFARADGERYVDRSFVHARVTTPLAPRFAAEAFVQAEQNAQQLLERRYLIGAGLRLTAIDQQRIGLAVGVTPMVEYERLGPEAAEPPTEVVRLSSYVTGRLALSDATHATATVYVQPRADRLDDQRTLGQAALRVQATPWVAVELRAHVRHDSDPPADLKPTDLSVRNALIVTIPRK